MKIRKSKLTIIDWVKLIGFVLVYFFFIKSKDIIINYPYLLLFSVFAIVLVISTVVQLKKIRKEYTKIEREDHYLFLGIKILKIVVIAYFVSGIILIPFNYYTIYNSKKNISILEKCEITGISTYSKNRTIFYKFKGKENALYGFKPIMETIKENNKFKEYYFVAKVKKGFLDTYILENWDIVQK